MTATQPIVTVSQLHCSLGGNPVLEDVSFHANPGDYVSVIGPNGAGKTTLLRCLNRIIADWKGDIRIAGRSVREYRQKELARQVGYVPQQHEALYPFTVREFVLMSRYPFIGPFSPPRADDRDAVEEALEITGMSAFAERRLTTLSGGERQKVFIASALAQDTDILLLDEPITFLDPRYQYEINRLLKTLNREHGTTVIAVSHDINSAVMASERILALKEGKVVYWGSEEDLMNAGTLRDIFDTAFVFATHPVTGGPVVVPEH